MKKKTSYLIASILIMLSAGNLSCKSQSKEKLILGEWQFQEPKYDKTGYDKNEVFVFFKNNVVWHGYISGDTVAQKVIEDYWLRQNGKVLEIVPPEGVSGFKGSVEIVELTNQTLILKPKKGTENLVLKKIKVFKD
jgi:hypothetical protein